MSNSKVLLEVKDLKTHFFTEDGVVPAVDGVSFSINKGEMLGIVGESGCGKTVTGLSLQRLVPYPGRIVAGQILLEGKDLLKKSEAEIKKVRGNDVSMIFQEPTTSLNPLFTTGFQICESLKLHRGLSKKKALKQAEELLAMVGIASPARRLKEYPHQLSGGMKQRVMIAIALSCYPKLLVADEPTTALDVTIQAQILELINQLRDELGMATIMITHDLGVIAETVSRVVVMYGGKIVEVASVEPFFEAPLHPYSEALLKSIPKLGQRKRLHVIPGHVPDPSHLPRGCKFNNRCSYAFDKCFAEEPLLVNATSEHLVRCWLVKESGKEGVD